MRWTSADNTYEITVVITDATDMPNTDANQRTLDYVVTVLDVNERPDITEFLTTELDWTSAPTSWSLISILEPRARSTPLWPTTMTTQVTPSPGLWIWC